MFFIYFYRSMGNPGYSQEDPDSRIFILSGTVQGGKTTFLQNLIEPLGKEGLKVTGFLCKGAFANGQRSAFALTDLKNEMEMPLASQEEKKGWFRYRRFYFNPAAFNTGVAWVEDGLKKNPDIVVVDEVGPMELEGMGWWSLLKSLETRHELIQLWTVRELLLSEITEMWNVPRSRIFPIDSAEPSQLIECLKKESLRNKTLLRYGNDAGNKAT